MLFVKMLEVSSMHQCHNGWVHWLRMASDVCVKKQTNGCANALQLNSSTKWSIMQRKSLRTRELLSSRYICAFIQHTTVFGILFLPWQWWSPTFSHVQQENQERSATVIQNAMRRKEAVKLTGEKRYVCAFTRYVYQKDTFVHKLWILTGVYICMDFNKKVLYCVYIRQIRLCLCVYQKVLCDPLVKTVIAKIAKKLTDEKSVDYLIVIV